MIPQILHFFNRKIARIFSQRTFVFGLFSHTAVNIHVFYEYCALFSSLYLSLHLFAHLFSTISAVHLRSIFIYGLLQDLRHSASVLNEMCSFRGQRAYSTKTGALPRSHFGYRKAFFPLQFSLSRVILTRINAKGGIAASLHGCDFPFFVQDRGQSSCGVIANQSTDWFAIPPLSG